MSSLCLKCFLQRLHDFSDFELEKQCINRISFRKFLDFIEYVPDSVQICSFKNESKDIMCSFLLESLVIVALEIEGVF